MNKQQQHNWRPWLVFIGCGVLSFVGFGFIVNTMGLYYTPLGQDLAVSRTAVSFAGSLLSFAAIPTTLIAGNIIKRIDTRILLTVCVSACALLFFAMSMFTELWQFNIAFALMGVFYVIPVTMGPSVLLANWFEDKLGLAMGIALGVSGLGGMILNPVVASWITNYGWRTSYRMTAVVLALCILPFAILVLKFRPNETRGEFAYGHGKAASVHQESKPDNQQSVDLSLRQSLRTRSLWLIIVVAVLLQAISGFVVHLSAMESSRGLDLEQGALVVSGIMLGAAIGKATIGILLDRLPTELVIAVYSVVGLLGWGCFVVVHNPISDVAGAFLAGLGQGVVLVAVPWMVRQFFGLQDYSTILSVTTVSGSVAYALANVGHGAMFDAFGSYTPSLVVSTCSYVVAAVCAIAAYRMRPKREIANA